jgi:cobalt-zinc-cadmium resistance protein CzcA
LQEARARLAIVVPVALGLIFILVFMSLGSLRQTLLVYTGIPLAVPAVCSHWREDCLSAFRPASVSSPERRGGAERPVMISFFSLRERGRGAHVRPRGR